ncbi:MAG: META domain-containing protein [Ignavibacteria bacterium]|nr:META domain-containing protein [Ignavibacteria bacterium]
MIKFIPVLFIYLSNCITLLAQESKVTNDPWLEKRTEGIDFIASGNEPPWKLNIDIDGKILFLKFTHQLSGIADSVEFTNLSESQIMGSAVTMYNASNEEHEITIEVTKEECRDNISGEVSPYYIKVRKKTGKNSYVYVGCGRYLADYRLNGKWSIEKVNNKTAADYHLLADKSPFIEFSIADERFSGYAGCNRFFGSFEAKGSRLTFGKTASTLMMCQDIAMEKDVFDLINDKTYEFKTDGNSLTLQDKKGTVYLELRKAE